MISLVPLLARVLDLFCMQEWNELYGTSHNPYPEDVACIVFEAQHDWELHRRGIPDENAGQYSGPGVYWLEPNDEGQCITRVAGPVTSP